MTGTGASGAIGVVSTRGTEVTEGRVSAHLAAARGGWPPDQHLGPSRWSKAPAIPANSWVMVSYIATEGSINAQGDRYRAQSSR